MSDLGALQLRTNGLPSTSSRVLGDITNPVQNGKMPGGVALNASNPGGEYETQLASRVDPVSALHPKSSPLTIVVLGVLVYVWLNARAKRRG